MLETIPTGVSNTQEENIRPFPRKKTISVVINNDKMSYCNRMGKTVIPGSLSEYFCNL
jgi:hypothetical protein